MKKRKGTTLISFGFSGEIFCDHVGDDCSGADCENCPAVKSHERAEELLRRAREN